MPHLYPNGLNQPRMLPPLLQNTLQSLLHHPLSELSGALGDLGTLLPLMTALAAQGSIFLTPTLFWTGIYNIYSGLFFGVPLPVQPMKALAASALSGKGDSSPEGLSFAGLVVGSICAFLAATGLLQRVARGTPVPIVKGVQFSAGISLMSTAAGKMLADLDWTGSLVDSRGVALLLFAIHLLTSRSSRFPFALLVFTFGTLVALSRLSTVPSPNWPSLHIHVNLPRFSVPALSMAISQTPLTLLNSIIAVTSLSADLLPDLAAPQPTTLAYSIFGMNLISSFFSAMPVCHGSGGLAAQYRFGSRSGGSVVLLGIAKVFLAITFGSSLLPLLSTFPKSILGITVLSAGLELSRVVASLNKGASDLLEEVGSRMLSRNVSKLERQQRWDLMMVTAGVGVAFKSDAVGVLCGCLLWSWQSYGSRLQDWWGDMVGAQEDAGDGWNQGERRLLLG